MPKKSKINKQHEELVETLKFVPIKANIILSGYGGEIVVGTIDKDKAQYFEDNDIDLDEYATDWDNESGVPEDMQPFTPGEWHDCDDIAHESGVEMSELCYITIVDVNGKDIWQESLDPNHLEEIGVTIDSDETFASDSLSYGDNAFIGQSIEKGTFFDGEILLRAPFDPKKLRICYTDIEGWLLVNSVEYDGEEVEGYDGYDTRGKSMEFNIITIE